MRRLAVIGFGLVHVCLIGRAACAQAIALAETGRPEIATAGPARLKFEGFSAGLSLAEVQALLSKRFAEADLRPSETTLTLKRDGKAVTSQPFTSEIETPDGIDIAFSAPTIGSRVIGVTYAHSFLDRQGAAKDAPTKADLVAQLRRDFGPESKPEPDAEAATSLIWNFNAAGMVPCGGDTCSFAKPYLDLSEVPRLAMDVGRGHRLSILVTIRSAPANARLVGGYSVTMEDTVNELLSLREAEKQLGGAVRGQ